MPRTDPARCWGKLYFFGKAIGVDGRPRFQAYGGDMLPLTDPLLPWPFVFWALLTQQHHLSHVEYLRMSHLMASAGLGPTTEVVARNIVVLWPTDNGQQ